MRRLKALITIPLSLSWSLRWSHVATLLQRIEVMLPVLILLGLSLRLYKLGYWDYWDDEVISTFAAGPSVPEIFSSIADYSVHPPFYYALLHVWTIWLGNNLIAIRLLSVLISTACVPMIYLVGRLLTNKPTSLVAAFILAISPFHIFHGQQARMYPLLVLLIAVAIICFLQGWRQGGWKWWMGLGLCCMVGFYTHIYFGFSLAGLNIWALYETYRQRQINWGRWGQFLLVQIIGVLAFVPFLPQILGTVDGVVQWYWIRETTTFDWVFVLLSLSNNATAAQRSGLPTWYLVATYLPGVTAMLLSIMYSFKEAWNYAAERANWVFLHLLIWTPIVIATGISLTIRPILLDRSLIGISLPLYVLMAWMFTRFWRVRVIQIVALTFVASCAASLAYNYPDTPHQNSLVRLADYVASEQQSGDAIGFADWQTFDTALLTQPQLQDMYILASPSQSKVQFSGEAEWLARLEYMGWQELENVQPVSSFAPNYQRVWLVFSLYTHNLDYHRRVNEGWLEQNGTLIERLEFERAVVLLYELEAQQ